MKTIHVLCVCLLFASTMALAQSNPVPLINNPLVPASAAPGGAAFTLTVNGTGFVSASVVNWNGSALATTFVSSSQLTAMVPASDIAAVGTASLGVTSPAPGGGTSNVEFFPIRQPFTAVSFGKSTFAVGASPGYITAADLNGDGKLDLVVTDGNSSAVSVLLGNGDNTFQSDQEYAVGALPGYVVAADFNRDGILDLAVSAGRLVSVLLGNGDGTFQAHQDFGLGDIDVSLMAGDFNGDGKLDLVATAGASDVAVLIGNGDGTFQGEVDYFVSSSLKAPAAVAIGDFNNDGKLDLAVTGFIAGTYALLGNGDGTFQNSYLVSTDSSIAMIVGDFNGDGKLDLALYTADVLLGNGDGTFQPGLNSGGFLGASDGFVAADLNGDGKLDLALTNNAQTIANYLSNGDGTFQNHGLFPAGSVPAGMAAGDFDGDGKIDLAVVNQSINDSVSVLPQVVSVLSRTNIAFGKVTVGSSSVAKVKLSNISSASFAITSITLTGRTRDSFTESNNCGSSLGAGSSCTLTITFKPLTKRSYTGVFVKVVDSAVNEPQTIVIRGTGTT
jgi:hypothetical protein